MGEYTLVVNTLSFTERKRVRKNFGKLKEVSKFPNLIEIQKKSYEEFLLEEVHPSKRLDRGLQKVFKSVFPLEDFSGSARIEYIEYSLQEPKFDVDECRQRDKTYAAPLNVKLRLIVFDIDEETESRTVKDIKEQEIYLCDLPLMTQKGTFITNGTERVVVSQMHRSPGVFFDHDNGKTHSSGKLLFGARVIPYRGSWLDIEFDHKDILHCRIDRKKKIPITTFLMSMGVKRDEILNLFYNTEIYNLNVKDGKWKFNFNPKNIKTGKLQKSLINAADGKVAVKQGTKINPAIAKKLSGPNKEILIHYNKSKSKAKSLKKELEINGTKVYLVKEDLSKETDLNKMVKFAKSKLKFFDCLINNASLFENDKLDNFTSKSWEKHISTNLKAPALLSKEFSKNIRGKNNNIINIVDQRVFKLTPYFFSYTLSKTGLYTLTKTSAMSLSPNIRVNGIAPGPTIKNKRQSEKHFKNQYLATPLKKQVDVIEICNAVDFFLKNSSITGQVLAIDSGQSLNWQTPDIIKGKE